VVGLAVARALALAGARCWCWRPPHLRHRHQRAQQRGHPRRLYYPQGSLKARLCVQGRGLLYAYCAERAIPHQRCGKLVVATADAQREALRAQAHALGNGVALQWLECDAARALEPALECVAALHSPDTGIVDSHALMLALLADVEQPAESWPSIRR
jgi:L-2-hydroxyglutarate oxidase LhgO